MNRAGLLQSSRSLLRSLGFALSNQIRRSRYDIVFYYPSHFNRSENRDNPYFLPLYEACDKAGLRYLILEEPDSFFDARRNPQATPADTLLLLSILLRKAMPLKFFGPWRKREWRIGKILKILALRRLTFSTFITMSQSFVEHVRGMGEDIAIFDLQHGIFHANHETMFDARGAIARHVIENRLNFLLYGRGFKTLLVDNDPSGYYRTHAFVVGNPLKRKDAAFPQRENRKRILVSLQFMDFAEDCPECNDVMAEKLEEFLKHLNPIVQSHGFTVTLKHHPRFNHSVSLQRLIPARSPIEIETQKPVSTLLQEALIHVTFSSSTLLEASDAGVPTLLLQNPTRVLSPDFFVDELHYPLAPMSPAKAAACIKQYIEDPELYRRDREIVVKWQNDYFRPFDEKKFLEALRKTAKDRY